MTAVQPLQTNGLLKGLAQNEKETTENCSWYVTPNETGREGPDQVLPADSNVTTAANGSVRIKLNNDGVNSARPISVPGLLTKIAKTYPDRIAMVSRLDEIGRRKTYTYKEYESAVRTVAKAFIKLGLERYHGVCILGFNSPQWFISDVAAIYAGGIAVGIYSTNNPEACQYNALNSKANIIVVEDAKQLEKILEIKKNLPHLKAIVQYDGIPKQKDILSWQDLLEIGEKESEDKLNGILGTIAVNQCCTLVYTSGTVGNPKAVMLSHDNLLHNARAIIHSVNCELESEVIISYLPLSHVAAQVVDIFCCLTIAATVYFADKNALKGSLLETLVVARPTVFLGVPRVWEKIYEKMQAVARNNGPIKTWIANWAKAQGLSYNINKMNGLDYKHWGYLIAKWLIFNKVKSALGLDRSKVCISSAAPLNTDVKTYFMSLDIPIMEAYGMSECGGAHTLNLNNHYKLNSVGTTIDGFYTRLDNPDSTGEGEICMAGRHIFMGYLNEPEKTAETIDENGWLHSGDLGQLDAKNFLYVTGRIKELIITAGGENIPPVPIEHLVLSELPALSNALLIGDKKKYLTMLVTLKTEINPETAEPLDTLSVESLSLLKSIGSKAKTVTEIIQTRDPLVYEEIDKAIKRANTKAVSNAQRVQKFVILPHDFSVPTGELGPTLKIKRSVIHKMYENLIEEMYK